MRKFNLHHVTVAHLSCHTLNSLTNLPYLYDPVREMHRHRAQPKMPPSHVSMCPLPGRKCQLFGMKILMVERGEGCRGWVPGPATSYRHITATYSERLQ